MANSPLRQLIGSVADAVAGGAFEATTVAAEYGVSQAQRGLDAVVIVEEYAALQDILFAESPPELHRIIARFVAKALAASIAAHTEQKRLNDAFMEAPVAIAIIDGPEHVFSFANSAYRALVANPDLIGKPLVEAIDGSGASELATLLDQVRTSGQPSVGKGGLEAIPLRRSDEAAFLDFVYTPKRNAQGVVDGVMVTGWDVTELVASRQRVELLAWDLRARESELRLVMDELPFLISFVDSDERYGLVNKAYEDWFGIPAEQLVGRKVMDVIGPGAYDVLVRTSAAGSPGSASASINSTSLIAWVDDEMYG